MNIAEAEKIDGYMACDELAWLARMANKSSVIYEIGCYKGRTTKVLADNTNGVVYAIDPWNEPFRLENDEIEFYVGEEVFNEFIANLEDHINQDTVKVCKTKYSDFDNSIPPDFIFIDGDHHYEEVKKDIIKSLEIIKDGGILAGHDYIYAAWPGVRKAVDELLPNIQLINSIWFTRISKC